METIILQPGTEYRIVIAEKEQSSVPWVDVIDQMPTTNTPDDPYFIQNGLTNWWQRELSEITGITVHHTLSHNKLALANYFVRSVRQGGKGRPSTEYTFWVDIDGNSFLCGPLESGCWHDHTGHKNTNISIGIAGRWDYETPPEKQLRGLATLVSFLMDWLDIPIEEIKGHCERFTRTVCPGWNRAGWRSRFFQMLPSGDAVVSFSLPTSTETNIYDLMNKQDAQDVIE